MGAGCSWCLIRRCAENWLIPHLFLPNPAPALSPPLGEDRVLQWVQLHLAVHWSAEIATLILHPSPQPRSHFQPASSASPPPFPPLLSVVAGVLRSCSPALFYWPLSALSYLQGLRSARLGMRWGGMPCFPISRKLIVSSGSFATG